MVLLLNVTKNCNFQCIYCYEKDRTFMGGIMSFEVAKKALDFFLPHMERDDTVNFFGGEPLLYPVFIKKVIQYIKKNNDKVKIRLNTNGSLLDKNIISFFKKNNIKLVLSFDGAPQTQNYNRPLLGKIKKSYSAIVNSNFFDALINYSNLEINLVASLGRVGFLFGDFFHLAQLGFKNINIEPERGVFWPREKLKTLKSELMKINYYILKNKSIIRVGYLENFIKDFNNMGKDSGQIIKRCYHSMMIMIMSDGDIYPCNAVLVANNKKYAEPMKMMNVKDLNRFNFKEFLQLKIKTHFRALQRLNKLFRKGKEYSRGAFLCDVIISLQNKKNASKLAANEFRKDSIFKESIEPFFKHQEN